MGQTISLYAAISRDLFIIYRSRIIFSEYEARFLHKYACVCIVRGNATKSWRASENSCHELQDNNDNIPRVGQVNFLHAHVYVRVYVRALSRKQKQTGEKKKEKTTITPFFHAL